MNGLMMIEAVPLVVALLDEVEAAVFRQMAQDYHQACRQRPLDSRTLLALRIGARQFAVKPEALRRPERGGGRPTHLVETRQKLMAFTRVVSLHSDAVNEWKKIGLAFNRSHATVIHAAHKYGGQITAALS